MKRPNCKQSRERDNNWSGIIKLPELTRTDDSGFVCFLDSFEKLVSKYFDTKLEYCGKIISYSCIIE